MWEAAPRLTLLWAGLLLLARIARPGRDLTIVSYSFMVSTALLAADELARRGVGAEVVDLLTLYPMDTETVLASVRKTGKVLIAHEDTLTGGFGAEIAAMIASDAFERLDAPVVRVAAMDSPVPYAPALENAMLPQESDISAALEKLLRY